MLEQILDYIHNYFEKEIITGTFTVSSGYLNVSSLQNGQYYIIRGSVFNDGLHQHPSSDLHDEEFTGEIRAMAVPPAVVALSEEIGNWVNANSSIINSPFQSESFGGYSYTKKSSGSGGHGYAPSWAEVFASRLNRWRKIS